MEMQGEGLESEMGRVVAVIPAAGAGIRMGAGLPKQFLSLGGKAVLALTLEAFERCSAIRTVVLVVPAEQVGYCGREIVCGHGLKKVRRIVAGGARRQDSVRYGLEACPKECDIVVVHDGVRPLVRPVLIQRVVAEARKHGAAIAALPARETVKEILPGGWVGRTLDRSKIWMVQTPQAFRLKDLTEAHKRAVEQGWEEMPDDAAMLERSGVPVRVIEGAEDNIKVTTPNDLDVALFMLDRQRGADSSM
jgi:2-C-methyl-D-erythritol 4-phosphate cytidylyltransferase